MNKPTKANIAYEMFAIILFIFIIAFILYSTHSDILSLSNDVEEASSPRFVSPYPKLVLDRFLEFEIENGENTGKIKVEELLIRNDDEASVLLEQARANFLVTLLAREDSNGKSSLDNFGDYMNKNYEKSDVLIIVRGMANPLSNPFTKNDNDNAAYYFKSDDGTFTYLFFRKHKIANEDEEL